MRHPSLASWCAHDQAPIRNRASGGLLGACGSSADDADGASSAHELSADQGAELETESEIVLARFDYAYDQEAAQGAAALGLDPLGLLTVIDANEAAIEEAGVVQRSYTAPGDGHGIFEWPTFYELEVNGVTLVDALIAGESLDGVHCTQCTPG
jgi:hypothetical protein